MGILSGRDLLSGKYITAIITDSEDRGYFVALKHTLGNFFVVTLDDKIYAFTLKDARIINCREKGAKSFRFIEYDTSNFKSLRPETKELEIVLEKNALPKMNTMMFNIFKLLSRKEGKNFKEHNIAQLVEELSSREADFPEEVKNIKNYLTSLDIDDIVTPLRKITDFIEGDLMATEPSFLGEMVPRYQRLDVEHKKTTNTPIGPKIAWMKWLLILALVIMVIVFLLYANDHGWFKAFTDLGKSFEGFQGIPSIGQFTPPGTHDSKYYMDNYTPEALKAAIDRGEIDVTTLPPDIQELVKNVELPTVTP